MKPEATLVALAALALLAGCNRDPADESTGGDNAAIAAAGGNAAASGNSGEQGGNAAAPEEEPRLLLAGDGVVVGGARGSKISFGTRMAATLERVTPALGAAYERNSGEECGAGPMEFASWGSIVLAFLDDEFVGWELRNGVEGPRAATSGGAAIGTPRAELEAALGGRPTVEQSSLGIEFSAAGFSGLLSSEAPDARVTELWAGNICAMR